MEESNGMPQRSPFQKIRLFRRHRARPNVLVEKNLQSLGENKKLKAQELYYGSCSENRLTPNKPPVHQRLGTKRKVDPCINTSNLMPGQRFKLIRSRSMFKRKYSAQNRIQQIRQNQLFTKDNAQRIKLFRRPTNLVVQVPNSNFKKPFFNATPQIHSVRGSLDRQTQSEIHVIQTQSKNSKEIILSQPIFISGFGVTAISIHDRFSKLP